MLPSNQPNPRCGTAGFLCYDNQRRQRIESGGTILKHNWERPAAPAALDVKKIDQLMKPVFAGKRVVAADRIGTGLSNSSYLIRLEEIDEPYVLRLYSKDEQTAYKELAISERVGETVPVPAFIYLDASLAKYDKPWAVLEWKKGSLLRNILQKGTEPELASAAASVGRVLAQMHLYTFEQAGFLDRQLGIREPLNMDGEAFLRFIEDSLFEKKSGKWIGEDLTQALWSFCQRYAPLLSQVKEPPVLVHSDFNGLNVLVDREREDAGWSVSAVLDWEFAYAGSRYVDIANMLRYEESGSVFEKHFIRGYEEQGVKLANNWRLLSKLEDLVALCDLLNHSTAKTPNRITDLQRLIQKTVLSQ
jgi:aminoglycoside phosphotransferase (APT) family kinase protein